METRLCPQMLVGGIFQKIPFSSQGFLEFTVVVVGLRT